MNENRSAAAWLAVPFWNAEEKRLRALWRLVGFGLVGVTLARLASLAGFTSGMQGGHPALAAFVERCKQGGTSEAELALREKEGMPTGLFVTHPLSGEKVEVWVGNYVLMGYGDGAVMGVPGHDERDFAFAKKYGLPIRQVIAVDGESFSTDAWQDWYADSSAARA